MIPELGAVANAFSPSESDWIVSIRYRDGVVRNRRISPGTVTEDHAFGFALASDGRKIVEVDWMEARRASDRTVKQNGADDFLEKMRRMRR